MMGSQGGNRGSGLLAGLVLTAALVGAVQHYGFAFFGMVPLPVWAVLAVAAAVCGLNLWAERGAGIQAGIRGRSRPTPASREADAQARRVERQMRRFAKQVGRHTPS